MINKIVKGFVLSLWFVLLLVSGYTMYKGYISHGGEVFITMSHRIQNILSNLKDGEWSWLLPFVFIGVFVARPIFLIPTFVMNFVAMALFGPLEGFIWVVVAEQCSAVSFYYSIKYLAGENLKQNFLNLTGKYFAKMGKQSGMKTKEGFHHQLTTVSVLRLASFPFDLVTIFCAMTGIRIVPFALGTLLVSLPWVGLFFLTFDGIYSGKPINGLVFVLFIVVSMWLVRKSGVLATETEKSPGTGLYE